MFNDDKGEPIKGKPLEDITNKVDQRGGRKMTPMTDRLNERHTQ